MSTPAFSNPLLAFMPTALLTLLLLPLTAGCSDPQMEIDSLKRENARLLGELERTREELGQFRLQLRRAKKEGDQNVVDEPKTEERSVAYLLKALAEQDAELDRLQLDLEEALSVAERYRHAGERAVDQLNRRSGGSSKPRVLPNRGQPRASSRARTEKPPRIQIHETSVHVTGRLPSSERPRSGRTRDVVLALFRDGEFVAQSIQKVDSSGEFDLRYNMFDGVEPGDYSVQIQLGF